MPDAHRIRLHGGWTVSALPGDSALKRLARRFGAPRALDPAETVWLTCAALPDPTTITVNGTVLAVGYTGPFAADLTALLRSRNEVWLDTEGIGEIGEVAVEFRPAG